MVFGIKYTLTSFTSTITRKHVIRGNILIINLPIKEKTSVGFLEMHQQTFINILEIVWKLWLFFNISNNIWYKEHLLSLHIKLKLIFIIFNLWILINCFISQILIFSLFITRLVVYVFIFMLPKTLPKTKIFLVSRNFRICSKISWGMLFKPGKKN